MVSSYEQVEMRFVGHDIQGGSLTNGCGDMVKLAAIDHDEKALSFGPLRPELTDQVLLACVVGGDAIAALIFDDKDAAIGQQAHEIWIKAIRRGLQPEGMRLP